MSRVPGFRLVAGPRAVHPRLARGRVGTGPTVSCGPAGDCIASASSTISGVALGCLSARPSRGLPAASDLPTATTPCGRAGAEPHGARLGWPGQGRAIAVSK